MGNPHEPPPDALASASGPRGAVGESGGGFAESDMGGMVDGVAIGPYAGWWDIEPDIGRVSVGVPNRVQQLKALGNGQVPLQAAAAWILLGGPGMMERMPGRSRWENPEDEDERSYCAKHHRHYSGEDCPLCDQEIDSWEREHA